MITSLSEVIYYSFSIYFYFINNSPLQLLSLLAPLSLHLSGRAELGLREEHAVGGPGNVVLEVGLRYNTLQTNSLSSHISNLIDWRECGGVYDEKVGLFLGTVEADGDEDPVILCRAARPGQEVHLGHVVVLLVQNLTLTVSHQLSTVLPHLVLLGVADVLLDQSRPRVGEGAQSVGDAVLLTSVVLVDGWEIFTRTKITSLYNPINGYRSY